MSLPDASLNRIYRTEQQLEQLQDEYAKAIMDAERPIPVPPPCPPDRSFWYKLIIVMLLMVLYYYHINCIWQCPPVPKPIVIPKPLPSFNQRQKPRGCQAMLQRPYQHGDDAILHGFCSGGLSLAKRMA